MLLQLLFVTIIFGSIEHDKALPLNEAKDINNKPIIGIMAQKVRTPFPGVNGTSYISAAYVKYIESAGGRAVPIPTSMTEKELTTLFSYINGVLLPGGDIDILNAPYRKHAELLCKLSMDAQDKKKEYFPIWGTCMGMQTLSAIVAKTPSVISSSVDTWDTSISLNFTETFKASRIFANMPVEMVKILQSEGVTYNAHRNCVSTVAYQESKDLQDFFHLLSTNKDANGKEFLSTIEGKKYPIYGVQWHPEMGQFEFTGNHGLTHIDHSMHSVLIGQYMADFFVSEARKSLHAFPDKATEQQYLIFNDIPHYTGKGEKGTFQQQTYVF